jgi:hypothetical protein
MLTSSVPTINSLAVRWTKIQVFFDFMPNQRAKIPLIKGKIALKVLADGYGSLLAINDFKSVVFTIRPVHDIQGESFDNGIDNCLPLFFLIDKFPPERRADI